MVLIGVIIAAALASVAFSLNEGFGNSNYKMPRTDGEFPGSFTDPLLKGQFDVAENAGVSSTGNGDFWKIHAVVPDIGSFDQTTNNVKYPNSPDNGLCTPSIMCDGLYKRSPRQNTGSVKQLPEVAECDGSVRINYYNA